jgi:hypothetical protein
VGRRLPSAGAELRARIEVISEGPKMINMKFSVNRTSPRILLNLRELTKYLQALEGAQLTSDSEYGGRQEGAFARWHLVLPPYLVRETKPPSDDVKVSFCFTSREWARTAPRGAAHGAARAAPKPRKPRVNIFQSGKVNILGAVTVESAERMYQFFSRLFTQNWARLVSLRPLRDNEKKMRLPPPAALARPPPEPEPAPSQSLAPRGAWVAPPGGRALGREPPVMPPPAPSAVSKFTSSLLAGLADLGSDEELEDEELGGEELGDGELGDEEPGGEELGGEELGGEEPGGEELGGEELGGEELGGSGLGGPGPGARGLGGGELRGGASGGGPGPEAAESGAPPR